MAIRLLVMQATHRGQGTALLFAMLFKCSADRSRSFWLRVSHEPHSKPGQMRVSKGQSQPQMCAAAFVILCMVLGGPFEYQVLIVTPRGPHVSSVRGTFRV